MTPRPGNGAPDDAAPMPSTARAQTPAATSVAAPEPAPAPAPAPAPGPAPALRGFGALLACQLAGESLVRLLGLPLPGPVIGLLLLFVLLQWPPLRGVVGAAAEVLLAHLSLLFVPVGVGVVAHLDVVAAHGLGIVAALVLSTWVGLAVTAGVLSLALGRQAADVER